MSSHAHDSPWLVSRRFDLAVFAVPALIALALVPLQPALAPSGELPLPLWILAVLFVDVAHVWSTLYRSYLDPAELARRPLLYTLVPLFAYALALIAASISSAVFWTALAYLAVFHFVRQQYGWVALYEKKDKRLLRLDRLVDRAAIYAATLFPLLWWHAHLPRAFDWFVPGDFLSDLIPPAAVPIGAMLYAASLLAFAARQVWRRAQGEPWALGKIVIVVSTALCWGVGIVATNSDWAFTVTNVLIHGVPYFGIVWVYGGRRWPVLPFLLLPIGLAACEELSWDRLIWQPGDAGSSLTPFLLALLALPQASHYLLDGFIWRAKHLAGT